MNRRDYFLAQKSAEGLLSSIQIAKGFSRRHDQIAKLIKRHFPHFQKLGQIQENEAKTGGRPTIEYFLNEYQILFLVSLFGNSEDTVEAKRKLAQELSIKKNVVAFAEMHGRSDVIEEQLKLEE